MESACQLVQKGVWLSMGLLELYYSCFALRTEAFYADMFRLLVLIKEVVIQKQNIKKKHDVLENKITF